MRIVRCQPPRGLSLAALTLGLFALRPPAAQAPALISGVNLAAMDKTVAPRMTSSTMPTVIG